SPSITLTWSVASSSNDTAPPAISTLSLHDALPICERPRGRERAYDGEQQRDPDHRDVGPAGAEVAEPHREGPLARDDVGGDVARSEEYTSELQSRENLVCRLLLEKKKKRRTTVRIT